MPSPVDFIKPPPAKLSLRNVLLQIHLWCGVVLCIPLVLLGLTGSLLMIQPSIDRFQNPELYKAEAGAMQPLTKIAAAAAATGPEGSTASFIGMPQDVGDSALVRVAPPLPPGEVQRPGPPRGGRQVYVDPVSLKILGSAQFGSGFMRMIHNLHGNMLIPGRDGRSVVGWLGVVMLFLGFSGLIMWWPRGPRWCAAFAVNGNAKGARFHRELHGAVGIWGLIVFIIVSFSGVYLGFPQTMGAVIGVLSPAAPASPALPKIMPVQGETPADLDAAVAIGQEAVPGHTLRVVFPAVRPDQPHRFNFTPAGSKDGPVTVVQVDPWTRKVIEVRDPNTGTMAGSVMAWQRPLHEGKGWGIVFKILVFFSGFLPLLFVVTGISMWLMKRAARRKVDSRRIIELAAAE